MDRAHSNVLERIVKQSYRLCGEYIICCAEALQSAKRKDINDFHILMAKGEAFFSSAMMIEKEFTGDIRSCSFIKQRTLNMMERPDINNVISELLVIGNQARKINER